ncbi:MAG: Gfo/Idh/MocA family oxidoreductase [Verrucomicrobiota bacterium]
MTEEKTDIALVGVGYWGPNLVRNLISNPRSRLKYVIDRSADRREFVGATFPGVEVAEDIAVALEDEGVKGVVIATPAGTHYQIAKECLGAGKHLLVEKPLATSVEEVDELAAAADERGLVLMSGHTFIYNGAVRYLRELIRAGDLGEIRYLYCQRLNLGRIRSDVDAWWNLGPHDVSIIQYLLGDPDPVEVNRLGQAYVQDGIEDVVFVTIRYPENVIANIQVSWLDPHKVRKLTVVGSKKMAVYDDMSDNKIAIYDKGIDVKAEPGRAMDYDETATPSFAHRSGDIVLPKFSFEEPLKQEIDHFLACIEGGTSCQTGPAHTRRVIDILSKADV